MFSFEFLSNIYPVPKIFLEKTASPLNFQPFVYSVNWDVECKFDAEAEAEAEGEVDGKKTLEETIKMRRSGPLLVIDIELEDETKRNRFF